MNGLGLSAAKASLLPDALCSRIQASMKVLEEAVEKYGYVSSSFVWVKTRSAYQGG